MQKYSPRHLRHGPFAILCLVYLAFAASLSHHFIPVNSDEVSYSVHGLNIWEGHGNRYSLYDDVFASSVYKLRDATPEITQGLFTTWVGLWIKVLGKSYWHARLSSVGAGLCVLFIFYRIGCRYLGGPRIGAMSVGLLIFNPVFLVESSIVRPEMPLLLGESLILWFILQVPETFHWKAYLIGLFGGLCLGFHPEAFPIFLGFLMFQIHRRSRGLEAAVLVFSGLGFLSGALALLSYFELAKVYAIQTLFFNAFFRPPILSVPWHPVLWLWDLVSSIVRGQTYYIDHETPFWSASIALWAGGLSLGLTGVALPLSSKDSSKKSFTLAGLVTFLAMACFLRKKEMLYVMSLFPFVLPPLAAFFGDTLREWRHRPARLKVPATGALLLLMASFLCFLGVASFYVDHSSTYSTLVSRIEERIPDPRAKVLAPAILWFGWKSSAFRDIGATVKSHWYTGGRKDLREWLSAWKPSVLIVDPYWKRVFLGPQGNAASLAAALQEPVRSLGTVEAGLASDPLEIYEVLWRNPAS